MTDLAKLFGTNARLEQEGVDLHIAGECYITIKRAGGANREFLETFRRLTAPHRKVIDRGMLDAETDHTIAIRCYAQAVVIGWRGVVVNGEPVDFSRENFIRVMTALPELWRVVYEEAQNAANFREEEIAAAGKPSASG
jgi:hypothetical protein